MVVDISNPGSPQLLGNYLTAGDAWDVVLSGGMAFVADGGEGLRVIDVSTPTAIREVGFLDTPGESHALVLNTGHALIADSGGGLRLIDRSVVTALRETGSYETLPHSLHQHRHRRRTGHCHDQ